MKENKIIVILGDIAYPKSQALIIPGNIAGLMTEKTQKRIVKDGWQGIAKQAKLKVKSEKLALGGFFTTGPGRLKRRGVKKIYHAVIKGVPSDFTSITIVNTALRKVLTQAVKDGMLSATVCGMGIDRNSIITPSIARVIVDVVTKFKNKMEIKIIDDDIEFIEEVRYCVEKGCKNEHVKQTSASPKQRLDSN